MIPSDADARHSRNSLLLLAMRAACAVRSAAAPMSDRAPAANEILTSRDGAVVTATFNRPEARNAMTWGMYARLRAICDEVDDDAAVRVLVLRGAGGQAFVSGTDIGQFEAFETAEDGLRYERDGDAVIDRLERVRKPVIAEIEGFAVGAGLKIAAACDIRIATPDARLGAPIARTVGNCLSMAAYAALLDLIGPSRLKELIFTARLLGAEEAQSAGFIHEIAPAAEIGERVRAVAELIAGHAPITIQVTKEAVRRIQAARGVPPGDDLIRRTYASGDFKEGVRAFLEKRRPRWTGA
jgi:enoyl-CoA hydratase/carnithine racemase